MQILIQSRIAAFCSLTFITMRCRFCMLWFSSIFHIPRYVYKFNHCALHTDSWCMVTKTLFLLWRRYLLNLSKARLNILSDVSLAAGLPWRRYWQKELSAALNHSHCLLWIQGSITSSRAINCKDCHSSTLT